MDRHEGRGLAGSARLALLVLALLAATALVVVAQAQGPDGVEFGQTEEDVAFGEYVTFSLEATVAQAPERVWIVYRLEGERAENVAAADFSGDGALTAQYVWQLYPGDVAPGATVYYRWAVEIASGKWVESDESSFAYDDARFGWQVLEQGLLRVHYYKNEDMAQGVLDAGTDALTRLAEAVGAETSEPIDVYVYTNERDMALALPSRSQSYDEATVTLGMAMDDMTLLLLGRTADVKETAAHELSHIVVGRATDNPFNDLPRWLDEGLAMYAEGQLAVGNREALDDAIASDTVLSLRSMTSYPGDPALVDLYYGEAYSLAAYMLESYTPDQMRQLLALLGKGQSMEAALDTVYGFTLDDLEGGWRASLGLGPLSERPAPAETPTPVQGGLQHSFATPSPSASGAEHAQLPWAWARRPLAFAEAERLAA